MIHLVYLPFASITSPSLALGRVKAQLREAGLVSRVFHFNLTFAKQIQPNRYEMLARLEAPEPDVASWLFAEQAFGAFGPSEDDFLDAGGPGLGTIPHVPDPGAWLKRLRSVNVPVFLHACRRFLHRAAEPEVVGFHVEASQLLPALALGRILKTVHPEVRLVYSGPGLDGERGEELFRKIPWLDVVMDGEGDEVVVPVFQALVSGKLPDGLSGVRFRDARGALRAGPPPRPSPAEALNLLPAPDYDDFFRDAATLRLSRLPGWGGRIWLPFETTRGGDEVDGAPARSFAPERVKATIEELTTRHPVRRLRAEDAVLDPATLGALVPWLAGRPPGHEARIHARVSTRLSRPKIEALFAAGIRTVELPVASLSTAPLRALGSRVTALDTVHFLKVCREVGILPYWRLILGVPGERVPGEGQLLDWLAKITHLGPPLHGASEATCDRARTPLPRDVCGPEPMPWYGAIFPPETFDLTRVASRFEPAQKDVLSPERHQAVVEAVAGWLRAFRESDELPALTRLEGPSGVAMIHDTRPGHGGTRALVATEAAIYDAIAAPASLPEIRSRLRGGPAGEIGDAALCDLLAGFSRDGLSLSEGGVHLGLATRMPAFELQAELRSRIVSTITVYPARVETHAGFE